MVVDKNAEVDLQASTVLDLKPDRSCLIRSCCLIRSLAFDWILPDNIPTRLLPLEAASLAGSVINALDSPKAPKNDGAAVTIVNETAYGMLRSFCHPSSVNSSLIPMTYPLFVHNGFKRFYSLNCLASNCIHVDTFQNEKSLLFVSCC